MIKIFFLLPILIECVYFNPTKKITFKNKITKNLKTHNLKTYNIDNEIHKGYNYLKYLENYEIIEYYNNINNYKSLEISDSKNINVYQNLYFEIICTSLIILINNRLNLLRSIEIEENNNISNDQIFKDTMNFYIPLAQICNLDNYVEELGNLTLLYLFPDKFYEFTIHILNLNLSQKLLELTELFKLMFKHEIKGRIKSIYSAWNKNNNINEIYDLMAIRIIINSNLYKSNSEAIDECYKVLYTISNSFYTIRTKDYIKYPKQNGYNSIHTTIILDKLISLEIQIRTSNMDYIANFGKACNYKYIKKY